MSDLFDRPNEVLHWFSEPAGELFLEYVDAGIESIMARLKTETRPEEIYRMQGKIMALETILNIPDEIKRLEADKKAGKRT